MDTSEHLRSLAAELIERVRARVPRQRPAHGFLVRCAWCGRVQLSPGGPWLTSSIPADPRAPAPAAGATTHTICPDCHGRVQEEADAERALRPKSG